MKPRLGDLLVKAGVITDSQLRVALAQQRQHGGKLGEHLVRTNLITEQQLAIAIADQLGLVYNDCTQGHAQQFAAMLPEATAVQHQALPVMYDAGTATLHVAVADPLDENLLKRLAHQTGKRIELQVAPKALLRQFIKVAYANIELEDENTNEFHLVDINGRESAVKLRPFDDDLPEASVVDLDPVALSQESAPLRAVAEAAPTAPAAAARPTPFPAAQRKPTPLATPKAPAPRPAPNPATQTDSGEEALRLLWALGDLLIERGYFSRAELMAKLRGR
jgi:hypothetical protein